MIIFTDTSIEDDSQRQAWAVLDEEKMGVDRDEEAESEEDGALWLQEQTLHAKEASKTRVKKSQSKETSKLRRIIHQCKW